MNKETKTIEQIEAELKKPFGLGQIKQRVLMKSKNPR